MSPPVLDVSHRQGDLFKAPPDSLIELILQTVGLRTKAIAFISPVTSTKCYSQYDILMSPVSPIFHIVSTVNS